MKTKIFELLYGQDHRLINTNTKHRPPKKLNLLIRPQIQSVVNLTISRISLLLILIALLQTGYSQSDCATTPTSTYYNNSMDGAALGTYDDPLVIRLYIHLVRQGNGSGGVNATNLQEQIEWLDELYQTQNLYFDYCIQEVNCADCWLSGTDGRNAIKDLWVTNSLDDGINCYLFPPSFNQTPEAEDVGSKNCFSYVDATSTAHEIGHCLGLFHTFQGMSCPPTSDSEYSPYYDQNNDLVNGSNCDSAGDLICDTPADPQCWHLVSGCTFSNTLPRLDFVGHPFIDPDNILPKNIMSYYPCRQEFTDGQNRRMRDLLADDNVIGQVVSPFSHIKTVSGIEEWTSPKYFNHDLVIDGSLTISTEVGFAPGCGIILNGTLFLYGGTLTLSTYENTCPGATSKQWKGILINRSSTNTPALYIRDNSTIEHADQAISFNGSGNQYVTASNSKFIDNRVTYNNIRSLSGPAIFTNCDFLIDNDYLLQSYFPQVNTVHSAPILFGGCQFTFEPALPSSESRQAISSYDGQVVITNWGNIRSRFNNWTLAVRAYQNMGSKLTLIRKSDFIGNWRSIYNSDFQRMMVYNNTFDLSNDVMSDESWGIFSEGARQISYHDNQFSSTNSDIFSTGIYALGSGSENVVIGESDFSDLDVGVEAINAGNQAGGMTFLCNRNEGNRLYDFKTESGIGPEHGKPLKPAGNTFSHADNDDHDSDFRAVNLPGNYKINYYYDRTDPDQTPLYYSNTLQLVQTNQGNCEHFILFQDPVDSTEFGQYLDTHDDLLEEISNKQDDLVQPNLDSSTIRDLSADLYYLELERDANASNAVAFVVTRDTIDYDDLRTAIDLREGFPFAVARANTYLEEGDTAAMFEELESIPAQLTLSQDEEDDLSGMLLLDSMLYRVYLEGRIEDALSASELDTVESIADEGVGLARDNARALLCYFYDECYDAEIPFQSGDNPSLSDIGDGQFLKPRPDSFADQELLPNTGAWNHCNIYSIDGRIVKSLYPENDQVISFQIWTNDLPSGLYIIILSGPQENVAIKRWIW